MPGIASSSTVEGLRALLLLALAVGVVIGIGVGVESAAPPGPAPIASTDPGATVHVAATGPCPFSLATSRDVKNAPNGIEPQPSPQPSLMPPNPQFGTICWYRSAPHHPNALVHTSLLNYRSATALGKAIAALDLARPSGVFNCPDAFGDTAVLAFGYPNGASVDLWYTESGCQTLDNGTLTGYGYGPGAVAFARFSSVALGLLPVGLGGNGT